MNLVKKGLGVFICRPLLAALFLSVSASAAAPASQELLKQLERYGRHGGVTSSYDPFKLPRSAEKEPAGVEEEAPQAQLRLKTVFNGRALIGENWYEKGERVQHYTVTKITQTAVYLWSEEESKILTLPQKKMLKMQIREKASQE